MTCTTPNCTNEVDGTGWHAKDGEVLCQECWEGLSAEAFWLKCQEVYSEKHFPTESENV